MKINRFVAGLLESNGYVIYQRDGGACFVIDPGYEYKNFTKFIGEKSLKLEGILLTHHHHDHVGAVEKLHKVYPCPVYIHRQDADRCKIRVDKCLEDEDILTLEEEEIRVLHTPGHTHGSVCFYSQKSKLAFTGDTIFDVDIGRMDLEDGSPTEMKASLNQVINKWSNEIVIYPGHGDASTMKRVRIMNLEFIEMTEE